MENKQFVKGLTLKHLQIFKYVLSIQQCVPFSESSLKTLQKQSLRKFSLQKALQK